MSDVCVRSRSHSLPCLQAAVFRIEEIQEYRNGASVYICTWVGRGILCEPECYTAIIITIIREGNVFRSVSVILFTGGVHGWGHAWLFGEKSGCWGHVWLF